MSAANFKLRRRGFTLIELLIVIAVIAILAAIAIPNLLASRKAANESAAIGAMQTITATESTYRSRNATYGAMTDIQPLLDYSLGTATAAAGGTRSGYQFAVNPGTDAAGDGAATSYFITAQPVNSAGDRAFYTDESGVYFGAPTSSASPVAMPTTDVSGNGAALGTAWSQIGQ